VSLINDLESAYLSMGSLENPALKPATPMLTVEKNLADLTRG